MERELQPWDGGETGQSISLEEIERNNSGPSNAGAAKPDITPTSEVVST